MVGVPSGDAAMVGGAAFIVEDERVDAVAQAFFHHDQATEAAVVILERVDLLEADVEIEDAFHIHGAFFVVFQKSRQRRGDVFRCDTELGFRQAEFTGAECFFAVGVGAVCKGDVQFLEKRLRQGCGDVIDDQAHGGEVVDRFDDIVDFDGFEGGTDLVGAVDFLNLAAGQAVARHAIGRVGQVHLNILVDAVVVILAPLIDHAFGEGGERGC